MPVFNTHVVLKTAESKEDWKRTKAIRRLIKQGSINNATTGPQGNFIQASSVVRHRPRPSSTPQTALKTPQIVATKSDKLTKRERKRKIKTRVYREYREVEVEVKIREQWDGQAEYRRATGYGEPEPEQQYFPMEEEDGWKRSARSWEDDENDDRRYIVEVQRRMAYGEIVEKTEVLEDDDGQEEVLETWEESVKIIRVLHEKGGIDYEIDEDEGEDDENGESENEECQSLDVDMDIDMVDYVE